MATVTRRPAASAQANSSEGSAKPKPKRAKIVKVSLVAEGEAKLKADDPRIQSYDNRKHTPLRPADFESKSEAFRWRAGHLERTAAKMRKHADQLEKLGAIADNKKAKRLLQLSAQMDALKAALAGEGTDVNELLRSMGLMPAATDEAPAAE